MSVRGTVQRLHVGARLVDKTALSKPFELDNLQVLAMRTAIVLLQVRQQAKSQFRLHRGVAT